MDKRIQSRFIDVLGSKIHYLDAGEGDSAVLFLHGMPTSSFLWRNIVPPFIPYARCLAPDLIGMGQSDKPNIHFGIDNHIEYIDGFIQALNLDNITLVMHGWGSIIGFDYARRFPGKISGMAFFESHVRPSSDWNTLSLPVQQFASYFKNSSTYDAISVENELIKIFMPQAILGELSTEVMNTYQQAFSTPYERRVFEHYLQEVPLGNKQSPANEVIANYTSFIINSPVPKLMMYAFPGYMTTMETVQWCKDTINHVTLADLGEGMHFIQESNPDKFSHTLFNWYDEKVMKTMDAVER
ncbi:MAG TPA: haloalkane dehalogenase [Gammaproteobacteria bacterium]|nr:haloalkane dehalogenase [Gammaproteobacteria bacterium]